MLRKRAVRVLVLMSLPAGHRPARPRGSEVQGERDGDADHAEDQGLNEAEPVVGRRGEVFQINGPSAGPAREGTPHP